MSKSPTIRSSHAYYDGSVSSFDGIDGQVPEKHVKSYKNPNKFVSYVASYFDVIDDQVPEKHVKSYKNPNYHRSCPSSPKQFTDSELPTCYRETKSDDQGHEEYHVKRHVKEQTHLVKRHLLPTAGGAPFVICYRCLKPLQLPADFLLFKRRFHQQKSNTWIGTSESRCVSCVSTSLKIKDMSAEVTAWLDTSAKSKDMDWHVRSAKNIILGGELQKGIPSGSDQGSPLLTPDQKLGMQKSSRQAASPSCGCGSSDFSMKEGTALSSSSSSSDSESVSFNSSNYSGIPITIDGDGFTEFPSLKKTNQEAEDDNADSLLEGRENGSYEELLGGIIEYEEKLRVSNLRLQLSEEEAARLKSELHTQIESAQRDMKIREADLESERRQVFQLQKLIFQNLTLRLKVQGQLKLSQEDVAMLNAEFDSARRKVFESQDRIAKVTEKGNHVEALNKDLNMLKLKHDMHIAEKDVITAKVNTLMAEASS
ncbi:hypothetical protein EZV62_011886 [Acer yangbiense]|uniref:Probable zinc-ribbon domain-containing protein n=1 Tax=Acer yangbiense TaxID=1000413 RepID=A0A5C7I8H3_9ROSI|nr:hypothetical protein EZV62_011886 [Acer yangbiense]